MEIKLHRVTHTTNRHGTVYWYWRAGGIRIPLLTDDHGNALDGPKDSRFQAYVKRLNDTKDNYQYLPDDGTFRWLVRQFEHSPECQMLSERTQKNYAAHFSQIERMKNADGIPLKDMPIAIFDDPKQGKQIVRSIRDAKKAHRRAANDIKTSLGTLLAWAVAMGHLNRNPARDVPGLKMTRVEKRRRYERKAGAWPENARERFCTVSREMGYQELPLALKLMYYTTQRPADIVKARHADVHQGSTHRVLVVEQQKTGAIVYPVLHRDCESELASFGTKGPFLLMYENQTLKDGIWRPMSVELLGKRFGRVIRKAGLEGQEMRLLRHAGAQVVKRLIDQGAKGSLADLTGWSPETAAKMEGVYTIPERTVGLIEAWEKSE